MGTTRGALLSAALGLIVALAGCGGGGGGTPAARGRAVVTVDWPDRSRIIPAAANSVKATFRKTGSNPVSQVAARPAAGGASTMAFEDVPVGSYVLDTVAYPNADGSGVPLSSATVPLDVAAGQTSTVAASMASSIDHLELSPASPSLLAGQSTPLTVTAKDASGAVVLLWPNKLNWDTGNHAYATVGADDTVAAVKPTGLTPGSVSITVTDTESGKSATASLAVTSNATVKVTPDPAALSVGDTQPFAATVDSAPDASVTWSIQEGAVGGAITAGGQYTAGSTRGSFHVVATSKWDNSKTASAIANVQSGGLTVVVH